MKKFLAVLATSAAVFLAGRAAASAAAHTLSCTVTHELRQTTDYKKAVRPYQVTYTITNRGWKTAFPAGWYNKGIFITRADSITKTPVTYSIPNNSGHFIKSGQNFAWSKTYQRGYITAGGGRQFTFSYSAGGISVSDTDALLKKTFLGSCERVSAQ